MPVRSMTGFGRAVHEGESLRVTVEIKTVNHRYLKLSLRGPDQLFPHQRVLEDRIRSCLRRGSVQANIDFQATGEGAGAEIDEALAAAYLKKLGGLGERLGLTGGPSMDTLLALPGVVSEDLAAAVPEGLLGERLVATMDEALASLARMREEEGRNLREVLLYTARAIEEHMQRVSARVPEATIAARDRLRGRVERLLDGTGVSLDRETLAREVAILAERSDIAEELDRLGSHLDQLRKALDEEVEEPVGRRLEFLAQEIHREANTMAAKSSDLAIMDEVLAIKAEVEKIREQVANIE